MQLTYAPLVEASVCHCCEFLSFSPKSVARKSRPAEAACCPHISASTTPFRCAGSAVLGHAATVLAGMETGTPHSPTRNGRPLAPCWLQAVLEVDLPEADSPRHETDEQGVARTHLPHGRRESHMGCAADSRRAKDARLRYFRANRAALDEESAEES